MYLKTSLRRLTSQSWRSLGVVAIIAVGAAAFGLALEASRTLIWDAAPFPNASRVVLVFAGQPQSGSAGPVPSALVQAMKQAPAPFLMTAAFDAPRKMQLKVDSPRQVIAHSVDASLFAILGVPAFIGRTFTKEDEDGGRDVAVISYDLWRSEYGARSDIVGRVIRSGDIVFSIVGVMPRPFVFPDRQAQVWLSRPRVAPVGPTYLIGLLPAIDASAASVQRLQREALETGGPELSLQIVNLRDHATRHLRRPILYLLMGVVLLLALTLFNLMGLQLASVISRADELEIRAALGASAAALYLPAAIDALLLASASGLGAVGLVALGPELLRNLTSQTSAPWAPFDEYGLRYPAAVIAALVLTGGGSIPAMLAAVRVAGRTTRQSGRAALAGRLVVTSGQVCAATVLCAATFAFSASVTRLARVDLGFRAADV